MTFARADAFARQIPLGFALPNAPAHFVGRGEETTWLAAAVARGAVTVVWGLGGLGKSALALRVLRDRAASQTAIRIGLREGVADLRAHVIRSLAAAMGIVDGAVGDSQGEQSDRLLVDLADTLGHCVLIEDLHLCDRDQARALLSLVAAHCQRARWVVTSRADPCVPELLGQVWRLDAMPHDALTSLAHAWGPHLLPAVRAAAVLHAGGSPWRLVRCLAGALESGTEDELAGEEPRIVRALQTLAVVREEIPVDLALAILPDVTRDDLRDLVRRAFLDSGTFGVRLHDASRPAIASGMTRALTRDTSLRVARHLAEIDDVSANLESLRLFLSFGETAPARRVLERRGTTLIAAGRARELEAHVRSLDGFDDWKLRCAVEIGDAAHPSLLVAPTRESDGPTWLAWARSLFLRGKLAEGTRVAQEVLARPDVAPSVALEAAFHISRLAVYSGRHDEAVTLLRRMAIADGPSKVRRDALIASSLAYCSRFDEAHDVAVRCIPGLVDLPPAMLVGTASNLIRALVLAGHPRVAERVVAAVPEATIVVTRTLHAGLLFAIERVELAMAHGNFGEARRQLDELGPGNVDHLEKISLFCRWLSLRIWTGEIGVLDADLDSLGKSPCLAASPLPALWGLWIHVQLRMLRAEGTDGLDDAIDRAERAPVLQQWAPLVVTELNARRGVHVPHVGPEGARIIATRALMAGDMDEARTVVRDGLEDLRARGMRARELELLSFGCDLAILTGDTRELEAYTRALQGLATLCVSPRFTREAAFFAWFCRRAIDAATLEDLAMDLDVAPTAARRARALLGGSPHLDLVDRRVLDAKAKSGWRLPDLPCGPAAPSWSPGWGLDHATRGVWSAGRAAVSLVRHPTLWRVLSVLVACGGAATKEHLVQAVWNVAVYHPLRHDNRLRVTMRKLREQLGDDAPQSRCIRTTDDGYALVGTVRVFGTAGAPKMESGVRVQPRRPSRAARTS